MNVALNAENKMDFIDRSIKKPTLINETSRGKSAMIVLLWILNSIESDLANSMIYAELAAKV